MANGIGPSRAGTLLRGVMEGLENRRKESQFMEFKKEGLKLEQDKIKIQERENDLRARGQDIQREIARMQEESLAPLRRAEALKNELMASEAFTNMERAREQMGKAAEFNSIVGEAARQGVKPGAAELAHLTNLGIQAGRDPLDLTRQFELSGWVEGEAAQQNQKIALIEYLSRNLGVDKRQATDIVMGTSKANFVSKMVDAEMNSIQYLVSPVKPTAQDLIKKYGGLWEGLRGGEAPSGGGEGGGGGGSFRYNPETGEFER